MECPELEGTHNDYQVYARFHLGPLENHIVWLRTLSGCFLNSGSLMTWPAPWAVCSSAWTPFWCRTFSWYPAWTSPIAVSCRSLGYYCWPWKLSATVTSALSLLFLDWKKKGTSASAHMSCSLDFTIFVSLIWTLSDSFKLLSPLLLWYTKPCLRWGCTTAM